MRFEARFGKEWHKNREVSRGSDLLFAWCGLVVQPVVGVGVGVGDVVGLGVLGGVGVAGDG